MRRYYLIISLISMLLAIAPSASVAKDLRVMATHLAVYIFAKNVAQDKATVLLLIPPGTDVHEFTLKPLDLKHLNDSDIVLCSGAGIDDHIRDKIHKRLKVIDTSKGAYDPIKGVYDPLDPHIWLDPEQAAIQVKNIRDAMADADPENMKYYEKNAGAYISRLKALDKELKQGLSGLKGAYLITYHEAFNYFARRYGLIPYSITGPYAESPQPGRMRVVYDIVRKHGVRAVFVEKEFPKDSMERLKREFGVRVCTLNSLESGIPVEDYYETAMRENLRNILQCLGRD